MSAKLSIKELTRYYVDRYHLNTVAHEEAGDGLGTYRAQIRRIMMDVYIAEGNLWNISKPSNGARNISIEEFEKYCFKQWAKYIEEKCEGYDTRSLEEDKKNYELLEDKEYWDEKAEEVAEAHNRAMESEDFNYDFRVDSPTVSNERIQEKGRYMMLEAIYNVFYESFNWQLLKFDMEMENPVEGNAYNPEISGDNIKSKKRLASYKNYIGQRKLHAISNKKREV